MQASQESVTDEIIETVAKSTSEIRSGMVERRGYADTDNSSGEDQLEADVWANQLLRDRITSIEGVGELVSEEEKEIIDCGAGLSVAMDPLDGSSNIPANNIVGTIVGIYDEGLPCSGENLITAFYVVYGPLTTLTVARQGEVTQYAVEAEDELKLHKAAENVSLEGEKIYGFGGNTGWFSEFRDMEDEISKKHKLRYGGALVGDFNQLLQYGGVFGYPAKEGYDNGKYRILYEGNPIAYIAETAGGASTDGKRSVLKTEVNEIHQRTPFVVGTPKLVEEVEMAMSRH